MYVEPFSLMSRGEIRHNLQTEPPGGLRLRWSAMNYQLVLTKLQEEVCSLKTHYKYGRGRPKGFWYRVGIERIVTVRLGLGGIQSREAEPAPDVICHSPMLVQRFRHIAIPNHTICLKTGGRATSRYGSAALDRGNAATSLTNSGGFC